MKIKEIYFDKRKILQDKIWKEGQKLKNFFEVVLLAQLVIQPEVFIPHGLKVWGVRRDRHINGHRDL